MLIQVAVLSHSRIAMPVLIPYYWGVGNVNLHIFSSMR